MDGMNKLFSIILGLIVIVIIIAFVTGRFHLTQLIPFSGNKVTVAPTRVPTITPTPVAQTDDVYQNNIDQNNQSKGGLTLYTTPTQNSTVSGVTNIPKTGPEMFFPITASLLAVGIYLRKKA